MVKQLGVNYDETVKRWKTLIEMHTVNQHNMPITPDSESSWCTDSSDTEHEFEIEQFSTTGEVFKIRKPLQLAY